MAHSQAAALRSPAAGRRSGAPREEDVQAADGHRGQQVEDGRTDPEVALRRGPAAACQRRAEEHRNLVGLLVGSWAESPVDLRLRGVEIHSHEAERHLELLEEACHNVVARRLVVLHKKPAEVHAGEACLDAEGHRTAQPSENVHAA